MKLQLYLMPDIPLTNTSNLSIYRNNMHFSYIYIYIYIYGNETVRTQNYKNLTVKLKFQLVYFQRKMHWHRIS